MTWERLQAEAQRLGMERGIVEGERLGRERGIAEGEKIGHERGIAEGEKIGHERGIAEGEHNARLEAARRFLQMGLSVEQIAEGVGLSATEIQQLS